MYSLINKHSKQDNMQIFKIFNPEWVIIFGFWALYERNWILAILLFIITFLSAKAKNYI